MSSLAATLDVVLKSPRIWPLSWSLALVGTFAFLARRYGLADDLPAIYYYAAVGLGAAAWFFLVATALQAAIREVSAFQFRKAARKTRAAFALKNVVVAGRHDKTLLLHYKGRDIQRFRVVGGNAHFDGMVQQGLLDRDALDPAAFVQHFAIPSVIWKWLDTAPAAWTKGVPEMAIPDWEN